MSVPPFADHSDVDTRVLLTVAQLGPYATITEITNRLGLPRSAVHAALVRLRRSGLVDWEDRRHRTLRARVAAVALVLVLLATAGVAGAGLGRVLDSNRLDPPALVG